MTKTWVPACAIWAKLRTAAKIARGYPSAADRLVLLFEQRKACEDGGLFKGVLIGNRVRDPDCPRNCKQQTGPNRPKL